MDLFAIGFVVIAGAMWAGSGLAAEHFLMHNPHTAMDLTVFRMLATAGVIDIHFLRRLEDWLCCRFCLQSLQRTS